MTGVRARLERLTEGARRAVEAFGVALIAAYTVLVLLQVFFRYVLNESLFWAEELIRYGLVWSVLLGSAIVAHDRGHVRIDMLSPLLGPGGRRTLELGAHACAFMFVVILAVTGAQFVDRTWFQHSASLGVPMWPIYAAVPVGAALETWFMLFPRAEMAGIEGEGEVLL